MRRSTRTHRILGRGLAALALGLPALATAQTPSGQSAPQRLHGAAGGSPTGQVAPGTADQSPQANPAAGGPAAPVDAPASAPSPVTAPPADGAEAGGFDPALASGLGGGIGGTEASYFHMLGDQPPLARTFAVGSIPKPPPLPNPGVPPGPSRFQRGGAFRAVAVLPSVRGFKIAENQSPAPQDRIYYSFNYYDNLNQQVNARLGSGIDHLKAYRHILGFEKTFLEGRASFGLRMPIDSLSTNSTIAGFGGTTQAVGDLAAIFKYALVDDRDAGRLIAAGLLVSAPTGPRNFAASKGLRAPHNAALQPFLGFIQTFGDLYFQGFSAIDVPTNPNDVTFYYNDLGVGYYVYRAQDLSRFVTAVSPTFEVHVNTPLNHRDPYNVRDIAGSYDFVDLTFGTNIQIRRRGLLSLAIVEPVTGPRPFTLETIVQFNLRF